MRLLAIGDMHGCLTAVETLLDVVQPAADDELVTLGDYVDRGPDSRGVIDRLLQLETQTRWIPLLGNHDILFREWIDGTLDVPDGWLSVGGAETLASYGGVGGVPLAHQYFLEERCRLWYEPEGSDVFFVHGSAFPALPLEEQTLDWLVWRRITDQLWPHESGKTMICGHTAQRSGRPLVLPGAICIDTWVFGEGWLTCYDVRAQIFTQANQVGQVRRLTLDELTN